MNILLRTIFLLFCPFVALSQGFDYKDLQEMTDLDINRFDAQIGRKSFKRDYSSPRETPNTYNYYYKPKKSVKDETIRNIFYKTAGDISAIGYQTTSLKEAEELKTDLRSLGFKSFNATSNPQKPAIYQKNNFTVSTSVEIIDSITYYTFYIEKKLLPKAREVVYAEDLLKMSSHEYLLTVYGQENIKSDIFRFSADEGAKCTIVYPNTSYEAIYVWEDEKNYRDIAFILIGAVQMNVTGKTQHQNNSWRTRQGIYIGMPLHEVQLINGQPLNFYGWNTDQAGMLATKNSGSIDFKQVGVEFSCLDCRDSNYANTAIINSEKAIQDRRKIYVSTLILHPSKNTETFAAR